jgi:hypothetical protein
MENAAMAVEEDTIAEVALYELANWGGYVVAY